MAAFAEGIKVTGPPHPTSSMNGKNGESNHNNRTSLVSSFQKRHYGTVNKGLWKANGFLVHKVGESDTLQGIALRYEVPVSSEPVVTEFSYLKKKKS